MAEDLNLLMSKELFEALNSDNIELAEILLKRGANPNGVLAVEGVAPIHIAAGFGDAAVKLLLSYGGDPNVRSADGTTPLHVAAMWGDCDALHLLLLNGGNPYIRDQEGVSVIESASKFGHDGCVALLEYFCLLLNPEEDAVATVPMYTYQFRGNLDSYRTKEEVHSEVQYMEDFKNSPLREQIKAGEYYTEEFQKRLNRIEDNPNIHLDVTSPNHPLIQHKRSNSSPEASLHVHWADKLAQTLVHVPKPDTTSSSSSDTFITCSGEEQDHPNKFFTSDLFNESKQSGNYHSKNNLVQPCKLNVNNTGTNTQPTTQVSTTLKYRDNNICSAKSSSLDKCHNNHEQNTNQNVNKLCVNRKDSSISRPSLWRPSSIVKDMDDSLISSDESFIKRHQVKCKNNNAYDKKSLNNSDVFDDFDFSEFDSILTDSNIVKKKRVSFAQEHHQSNDKCRSLINQNVDKTFLMDKLRQSLNSISSVKSSVSENDVLNQSFCWPRHSLDSTLSETSTIDYIYTDKDKGIQFIERHLPSLQGSSGRQSLDTSCSSVKTVDSQETITYDWKAYSDSSTCTEDLNVHSLKDVKVPSSLKSLDNLQIREELIKKGDKPGPITEQTRQLYLVRLTKVNLDPGYIKLCKAPPAYSPELTEALTKYDKTGLAELEDKLIASFCNPNRCWREGTMKTSFNYILLDPRVTKNLPNRMHSLGETESFKVFVAAIFYIGKGKRSRPYSHLYQAIQQTERPKDKVCDKVKHILDIWKENLGVVSLHCFQNVIPVEAYTREACMVDTIGLNRLTNKKRGDFYGLSTMWTIKEKRKMGVYFLKKALQIFQGEGERQILPVDIKVGQ